MVGAERLSKSGGLIVLHPLLITFILLSSYPIIYDIPTPFWFIILAAFILSIIFLFLQNWFSEQSVLYLLFFSDIPLIGSMVHYTGGLDSLFPLLYIILIIVSSMYLFRKGSYIISISSVIFFVGLLIFEAHGSPYPMRFVIYRFYIFALLFLFTGILSGAFSERYRVRGEEVRRLRLTTEEIIRNLPSGIITIDSSGEILYTNIAKSRIRTKVHLYIAKFLKSPHTPSSISIELKSGKRYYILSCARIYDSRAALGVLQDLTDVRRLQEASRVSRQTKLLAELGGSLAHEIRNPLASIRGSLEVIRDAVKKREIVPFIKMAMKESVRLNEIVTDFLNFAQFTPTKMNHVRINDVLNEALLDTLYKAKNKNISVKRRGKDFLVLADVNKLKSVFINILNNAYEVSKKGQYIEIDTSDNGREGFIKIHDHGSGITKKDLKKIFDPFFTTRRGGTGLGLAIAKNIIEAHNGMIEATSRVGKGTTFTIILPAS
jgi:two-component system sensor histidine kinase PilS (NtrC family)